MIWTGRFDGDNPLSQRIYQRVFPATDYGLICEGDFVLHGFAVDEGVRRNQGRTGAKDAPDIIRKNMANFPVVQPKFSLKDFGNLTCDGDQLEKAQLELANRTAKVFSKNAKSIVLGGGHEVMYGHFSGLRQAFPEKKIGIINIDAHFDNRAMEPAVGATSGTGFLQIAAQEKIHSLHIGIQKNSNTLQLFDTAHQNGMIYLLADELFFENLPFIYEKIDDFIGKADILYLTICMDVFNASIAPGVSAAAHNGIFADPAFMHFFCHILETPKLKALDIAEVNPTYDIGERTARLAASLINEFLMV
ncbi:formimidoylglutamase [Kaistella palustris]|uniref:formimidoylglutamase n=1 Tax=Kaistella palustris TaxID=493376 RepID=UPI000413BCD1|nr:formimidoylglutamase [Kaistella palustris]